MQQMVHRSVRDELERRFSGGGCEDPKVLTREDLEPFGGEEMLGYLDARTETVTSLVDEVATAASGGTPTSRPGSLRGGEGFRNRAS